MTKAALPDNLEASWAQYDHKVTTQIRRFNYGGGKTGSLRLISNPSIALREIVEEMEKSKDFSFFLDHLQEKMTSHGYHKGDRSFWLHALQNTLRRSGYYSHIARTGSSNTTRSLRRVIEAFDRREKTVTYMAPMEYVSFEAQKLQCRTFRIERFSKTELDSIFKTSLNNIFYPWAVIDTAALSRYWFVVVKEQRSIPPLGRITFPKSFGQVNISYSPYPTLEQAFQRLVLFDWQPDYGRYEKPEERAEWQGWLGFKIPFVIRLTDDVLKPPAAAPVMSSLATEPYFDSITNEEIGEKPPTVYNAGRARDAHTTYFNSRN